MDFTQGIQRKEEIVSQILHFSHFGLSRIMQKFSAKIFFALICIAKKCKVFVKIEMRKSREKIRKFHQEFIKVKEEKLLIIR